MAELHHRLQIILQHCSKVPQNTIHSQYCFDSQPHSKEYMHFWRKPKQNKDNKYVTEIENIHEKMKKNESFANELNDDRDYLLNDINGIDLSIEFRTRAIMELFVKWLNTAFKYTPTFIKHPNAVCLSTINGKYPSSRYVLLKTIEINNGKFIFFTDYDSNKSKQLKTMSFASMTFYWDILDSSIRIEGNIEKVDDNLSDNYWKSRPKQSKLSAITSNQSQEITSKNELELKYETVEAKYKNISNKNVPRPNNWGGWALNAQTIEFWRGDTYRFHDRIKFKKQNNNNSGNNHWKVVRLQP